MGLQVIPLRAGVFIGVAFTGTSRVCDVIRRRSGLLYLKYRGGPAEVHPAGQPAERILAAPAGGIRQPGPAAIRPGRWSPMNLAAPGGTSCRRSPPPGDHCSPVIKTP